MTPRALVPLLLLANLLTGCSSQILEEASDINIPRDCRDTTKLFNSFNMRATTVAWSVSKERTPILAIGLSFENLTQWPIALSNSGNGVLYSVDYSLTAENGSSYAPKDTSGIVKDIHKPIALEETAEGKLVFAAPKANYLLAIERKFAGTPVAGKAEDHVSSCKISSSEYQVVRPSSLRTVSGVY